MNHPTLGDLDPLVPNVDEVRPFRSLLLALSTADSEREWSGSGTLSTWASRRVDSEDVRGRLPELIRSEQAHLARTYEELAKVAEAAAAGDDHAAAEHLLSLAAVEEGRDRADLAERYAAAACHALRNEHSVLSALARRRRGRALRATGRYRDAEREYARSVEIALGVGDRAGAAEAAVGAGNSVEEEGRWEDARRWYERALEILEPLDEVLPQRWHAELNLHVVLRSSGQIEASRAFLEQASRTAATLGDDSAAQHIENARGQLAMAEGDVAAAIACFRDALLTTSVTFGAVVIRINLAEALLAAERGIEAAEEARKAEVVAIAASLHTKLPEVYRMLGRIAAAEGNPDALVFFEYALEIIRAHRLPELERAITLQTYAAAEARVGEQDTADALSAEAEAIYRTLGIVRGRSEWADTFSTERKGSTS